MSIKGIFSAREYTVPLDVTLLVIRVVTGIAFMLHGWGKIQAPMSWMGPDAPVPGVFQFLAAFSEFGGGIAWALGFLFPLSSFGLVCTMAVATYFHLGVMGDPFVASGPGQGSYEPALVYLCIALLFMASGPGRLSLDRVVFGRKLPY
jgi:putative oxidoreductase